MPFIMPIVYAGIGWYLATVLHEKTANNLVIEKIAQEEIKQNKILMNAYAASIAYQKKIENSLDAWMMEYKGKCITPIIPPQAVEAAKQEILQSQLMHAMANYNSDTYLPSLPPAQN